MATHSSIPVWEIPCTEEPGGSQGHKESDTTEQHACKGLYPGSSLRGEVQKDVATFSLGLIQGEKETLFEPLLSILCF